MKLQVTQENLNKALGSVARIANGRSTLPILSNVLLKTIDNRLTIAATNLDIAITHFVGSKIAQEGAITVPARLMQDFVSSLPNGIIDLQLEDHKLHIKTAQYQSTINGVAAEEYPVMPAISGGQTWSIPAPVFKRGLQQVVFAASNDETRPVLTGAYLHSVDGQLVLAATDSYRLAEKVLMPTKQEVNLLIPASALQEVLRSIDDRTEVIELTHDEQQLLIKIGDVEIVTRLIDGKYPDYRKLIPQKFTVGARLKRSELTNITKVSSLFARESAGSVTIRVDEDTSEVSIHSIASQLGENTSSAAAEVQGNGDITLNSRYLLDGLGALSGDEVSFNFNGKLEPSVLRDAADDSYMHIIMPLKS